MSKSVNKIILIGNVGKDPEIRATKSGDVVANFTLATSEEWKDKATGEKQDRTEWHRIVVFKKTAEVVRDYVQKGSRLYIEGKIRTRKYQDGQAEKYITEITADTIVFLSANAKKEPNGNYQPPESVVDDVPFDDDIPF